TRIVDAMRSASGDVDVAAWGARIGDLGKREFVLKTARTSHPELFTSRWAMSYLRGPLTRAELVRLREEAQVGALQPAPGAAVSGTAGPPAAGASTPGAPPSAIAQAPAAPAALASLAHDESPVPPTVSSEARVGYLDPATPWAR